MIPNDPFPITSSGSKLSKNEDMMDSLELGKRNLRPPESYKPMKVVSTDGFYAVSEPVSVMC